MSSYRRWRSAKDHYYDLVNDQEYWGTPPDPGSYSDFVDRECGIERPFLTRAQAETVRRQDAAASRQPSQPTPKPMRPKPTVRQALDWCFAVAGWVVVARVPAERRKMTYSYHGGWKGDCEPVGPEEAEARVAELLRGEDCLLIRDPNGKETAIYVPVDLGSVIAALHRVGTIRRLGMTDAEVLRGMAWP